MPNATTVLLPGRRRLLLAGLALAGGTPQAAMAGAAPALHGLTENLAPLNYEEGGQARGFSSELLRLMAADAGLPLAIEVLPWQRAVQRAAQQAGSVLFSLTRMPERETQYQWVGPISARRIMVYRLSRRDDVRPASLQQLGGLRVGVVRDSAAARQLQAELARPADELEWAVDDATNLRKLLAGRMELLAMLDWAAAWHLRQLRLPYATLSPVLPMDVGRSYWFGLPADADPALVRRLQGALDRIRRDGRYERLRQRYFR
ncbi:MAG: transporter substrate-binding domain-containing protein [Burkholderiaceae bacterium]